MRRDLFTVVQLGASFAFIFSAFNSQGLIEVAVLRKKAETSPETGITTNSGYYSLSIIYFFFTFFNLVIPTIVNKLGSKWSQVIGSSGYLFFMLTFLHLNVYLLYFGSAVLGAGAALLWAGNGCYLVDISRRNKIERNSGIMWAMLQSSLITGGIFLIYVLRSGDLSNSFTFIYVVFSSIIALGIGILMFLPNNPAQYGAQNEDTDASSEDLLLMSEQAEFAVATPETNFREQLKTMLALLFTPNMSRLVVLFVYSGLETTYYTGVYTSCLAATLHLKEFSDLIIPYNALLIGAGQIVGGIVTGPMGKVLKIRSHHIIFLGFIGHLTAFVLSYMCLPYDSTVHSTEAPTYLAPTLKLTLVISFLLGVSDACWQTQIYVAIGQVFRDDTINAFAIFKFFQSMAACVSFFYSSFLYLTSQLLILVVACVASTIFFLMVRLTIGTTSVEAVREREV